MMLKMSTIAITLLAIFPVADAARMQVRVEEREQFENQAQIAAQVANKSAVEDKIGKAFEEAPISASDGTDAGAPVEALESPDALVQDADSQGSWSALGALVRKQSSVIPSETPNTRRKVRRAKDHHSAQNSRSIFSKTFDYVRSAGDHSRISILKAACDSSAFSVEEIIQFANNSLAWDPPGYGAFSPSASSQRWLNVAKVFAEGRHNTGCISDPANVESIVDLFERVWPEILYGPTVSSVLIEHLATLKQALTGLKPAKDVKPTLVQLHTGLRSDEDMMKLLLDMEGLQLMKAFGSQGSLGLYAPGSSNVEEFESWLKQIRADGEQFSGPQLVSLVDSIPKAPLQGPDRNSGTSWAICVLLQYLEQYVTGVTCEEVKQIINRMDIGGGFWLEDLAANFDNFLSGLDALKSNIVDGENKVDIVAFADVMYYAINYPIIGETEKLLQDVGVGLPPKNNPIWGVVRGNPVIFVVDASNSMDAKFTLGHVTITRRKFCHSQLETVLEGLPDGTYFNVIQYSSSAVKVFQKTVLASKTNIDVAMEAVSGTCRGDYRPGQDPAEMLRSIQAFALNFKYQLDGSAEKKAMEALQLAYAMADPPSKRIDDEHYGSGQYGEFNVSKDSPQVYFLTSGQPDGGARRILDNIDELDSGRNIPVNSIAFITPADHVAKQFVKDLASKTGGFFRSIEQALVHTRKRKRSEIKSRALFSVRRKLA